MLVVLLGDAFSVLLAVLGGERILKINKRWLDIGLIEFLGDRRIVRVRVLLGLVPIVFEVDQKIGGGRSTVADLLVVLVLYVFISGRFDGG